MIEMEARLCILDFLYGVLELNPLKRWTPQQALQHPFITQKPFTGPFKPDGQIKFTTSISSASTIANFDPSKGMICIHINKILTGFLFPCRRKACT